MNIDRSRINKLADSIREALELVVPPYEPKVAVKKLNGEIFYDLSAEDIDAYIEKIGDQRFGIHLSKNQFPQRERFTLAHELGHLFLHMGFIIDENKWNIFNKEGGAVFCRDNTTSKDEYEAHEFAAAFLMPKQEFLLKAKSTLNGDYYNVEALANEFGVSLDAATNRGKWLGIFQW
jgi:Zn-dependent peptidase ImmA (M78 family)